MWITFRRVELVEESIMLTGFVVLLTAGLCAADSLEGREIVVRAGSGSGAYAPVTMASPDGVAAGEFVLRRAGSRRKIAATARKGDFIFVPEAVSGQGEHRYEVISASPKKPPAVSVEKREGAEALDVRIDGKLFTAYWYSKEEKKPYLWPVLGEGGISVTRDWPMGEREKSRDHVHHRSLWSAYGDVNGADCWGEGPGSGTQHSGEVTWGSGGAYGWIEAKNIWLDGAGEPVVAEEREYRFYAGPAEARIFDVVVTFEARFGEARFGDTKEGGIVAVRMRDGLRERGGSGVITNAAGGVGAAATWGKPAAWCDYSGTIEGTGVRGLAIFDHPGNLRHPTTWHVRDYGLMGANCFGYSYFTGGKEQGDFVLKEGESLVFRYRVYVHSGDVTDSGVATRYADFSAPPTGEWVD